MPNKPSLIGLRFARLIVTLEIAPQIYPNSKKQRKFLCKCDCGKDIEVTGSHLKTGHTKSCGCLNKEMRHTAPVTHGHARIGQQDGTYRVWRAMKTRCTNPNQKHWDRYGGRGITICERWKDSFENFLADMGPRPKGLTLERKDYNLGYSPENCEWATYKTQARNKSNNVIYTVQGITDCMAALCERFQISHSLVSARILRLGWSPEEAFTTPVNPRAASSTARDGFRLTSD